MVKKAKEVQPKAFDVEVPMETGHNPVLSKIDELVAVLRQAAIQ